MRYVRIYADEEGESHFGDVDIAMTEQLVAEGVQPLLVSDPVATTAAIFVQQPDEAADWNRHVAPRRQLVVLLEGRIGVVVSDGERRELEAGDVVLAEDTTGEGHVSTPLTKEIRLLMLPLAD